jgi:hypothetical protein
LRVGISGASGWFPPIIPGLAKIGNITALRLLRRQLPSDRRGLARRLALPQLFLKPQAMVVKGGIKVKGIRLVDAVDGHNISCKIDGIGAMNLKSDFVKKA